MATLTGDTNEARRSLLKALAFVAAASPVAAQVVSPSGSGTDERWQKIAAEFPRSAELLNLNNAAVSPQPRAVQEAMWKAYRYANEIPDVNMWDILDAVRPRIKEKLAKLVDCDPKEVALNRNSTEGLCTAIFGIELKAGDEVVLCEWDYETMRNAWEQRARREGIKIVKAQFDLLASDEEIIAAYRRVLTARTKVLHVTHVVHYTGRVIPVETLCSIARERGIQTIVDAAQSFAQMPVSFRRIGCDYLAASLHKWLCAPFGTGMLIVREPRQTQLWPLIASYLDAPRGMDRFDAGSQATYSSAAETAIEPAIDFHNEIGTKEIQARLQYLTRYWTERAKDIRGFRLHTPVHGSGTNALALFSLEGKKVEEVEKELQHKHGIRVRYRKQGGLAGLRVSPHMYTSTADLDRFVTAVRSVASSA